MYIYIFFLFPLPTCICYIPEDLKDLSLPEILVIPGPLVGQVFLVALLAPFVPPFLLLPDVPVLQDDLVVLVYLVHLQDLALLKVLVVPLHLALQLALEVPSLPGIECMKFVNAKNSPF